MKPKERILNYALLSSANCAPNATDETHHKQESPIDLSVRKKAAALEVSRHLRYEPPGAQHNSPPPPHPNEWIQSKYCLPNVVPIKPCGYPSAPLLPYLFINPNCFPEVGKKTREELIYEHERGLGRVGRGESLLYHHPHPHYARPHETFSPMILPAMCSSGSYNPLSYESPPTRPRPASDKLPPSTGSSSACSTSSSSPSNNAEYHYPDLDLVQTRKSTNKVKTASCTTLNGSHQGSRSSGRIFRLRRSLSTSSLRSSTVKHLYKSQRTRSENNLHLITNFASPSSPAKVCAPKKLFASNYYQSKLKEELRENLLSSSTEDTKDAETLIDNEISKKSDDPSRGTKSYRNYRKEAIESWGIENKDDKSKTASNENALDLRTSNPNNMINFKENCDRLNNLGLTSLEPMESSSPLHVDLYRQYYCYLLQDPAFTSKAAMAAVVEAYAKIMSSPLQTSLDKSPLCDKQANMCLDNKRVSPDFILTGSKSVELCSADTTITFERKRISRPLTGKHVRHGTGASPSTLVSLRNMIQQRQKFREHGLYESNGRYAKNKTNNKRVKRK